MIDITERLPEFDCNDTIYVAEPWTVASNAIVAQEPETGGLPADASEGGMKYFLEVSIASDFVKDWVASLNGKSDSAAVCQRLIDYAVNDA